MNILITGASRGIGKATAKAFAAEGYDLYLSSRNPEALQVVVEELSQAYPAVQIQSQPADLSLKANAVKLGKWMLQMGVVPDVVVNNAGIYQGGNIYDEAEEALENQIALNLMSAYHLTRMLLPGMMDRKSGHIFNMCSIASLGAYPNGGSYSISKFALYGFSRNLREEMKPHGIKVTAVLPGAVLTDSWQGFDNSKKRIMEAEDIAAMVVAATRLSLAACVEEILIRPQLGDL